MNAVDTNVLIYAVSSDEQVKGPVALQLLDGLSATDTLLLWQVVCELGSVLAKLKRLGRAPADIGSIVAAVRSRFPLVMPSPAVLDECLRLHHELSFSYWDAMLIAACREAGVDRLYSEDLPGREVSGLVVENPFVGL